MTSTTGGGDRIRTGDFYDANVAMRPPVTCLFARTTCSCWVRFGHRRALRHPDGQQMSHVESRRGFGQALKVSARRRPTCRRNPRRGRARCKVCLVRRTLVVEGHGCVPVPPSSRTHPPRSPSAVFRSHLASWCWSQQFSLVAVPLGTSQL